MSYTVLHLVEFIIIFHSNIYYNIYKSIYFFVSEFQHNVFQLLPNFHPKYYAMLSYDNFIQLMQWLQNN